MEKKFSPTLLCFLLFSACMPLKEIQEVPPKTIDAGHLKNMDGFYANCMGDSSENELYRLLFKPFKVQAYLKSENLDCGGSIEIKQISKRRIKITYWKDEKPVRSKKLRGKQIDGFFVANRKLIIWGIPCLLFSYKERRVLMGFVPPKTLVVKMGNANFANIFILAGSATNVNKSNFEKQVQD